jgi:hypothetical protein
VHTLGHDKERLWKVRRTVTVGNPTVGGLPSAGCGLPVNLFMPGMGNPMNVTDLCYQYERLFCDVTCCMRDILNIRAVVSFIDLITAKEVICQFASRVEAVVNDIAGNDFLSCILFRITVMA